MIFLFGVSDALDGVGAPVVVFLEGFPTLFVVGVPHLGASFCSAPLSLPPPLRRRSDTIP